MPPPAPGSARQAADLQQHQQTRALRNTPRWEQACKDVNLKFPEAAGVFSCTLDIPVSQEATPHLSMLLRRSLVDAGTVRHQRTKLMCWQAPQIAEAHRCRGNRPAPDPRALRRPRVAVLSRPVRVA